MLLLVFILSHSPIGCSSKTQFLLALYFTTLKNSLIILRGFDYCVFLKNFGGWGNIFFWIHHDNCTHELTAVSTACTKPAQAQDGPNHSMESGAGCTTSSPVVALVVIMSCWERKGQFSLKKCSPSQVNQAPGEDHTSKNILHNTNHVLTGFFFFWNTKIGFLGKRNRSGKSWG